MQIDRLAKQVRVGVPHDHGARALATGNSDDENSASRLQGDLAYVFRCNLAQILSVEARTQTQGYERRQSAATVSRGLIAREPHEGRTIFGRVRRLNRGIGDALWRCVWAQTVDHPREH